MLKTHFGKEDHIKLSKWQILKHNFGSEIATVQQKVFEEFQLNPGPSTQVLTNSNLTI